MRAWMFSSVASGLLRPNTGFSAPSIAAKTSPIGTSISFMPRFFARARASVALSSDVYGEGMNKPRTFFLPSASTAMAATREESMPPLKPMTTPLKPFFST